MKKTLNVLCICLLVFLVVQAILPFCVFPFFSKEELGYPSANWHDVSKAELTVITVGCICLFILGIISFIKFIKFILNINKGNVFDKKNIPLLRWIGCSYIYIFVYCFVLNSIIECDEWIGAGTDTFVLGTFCLIIAEVFAIGIKLKEEQDLTI